jgi:adenylylsulfate kinase-like enzyme
VEALLLTGGLASGKTATAVAVGEALERDGVAGAVVDLDWLCWAWSAELGDDGVHQLLCRNLAAILPNLVAAGVRRLVLARGVLRASDLDALRRTLAETPLVTVRLTTTPDEARARLAGRDAGAQLGEHRAELASFDAAVAAAAGDAPVVDTTGRDVEAVAADVLRAARWD